MKKFIGEYISIRYSDRPTPIDGLVVDYNEDWTLLKNNPIDFVIDGYKLIKHKNIKGFQQESEEKFKEYVINLKGITVKETDAIQLDNLEIILNHIEKEYGLFQLELKSEKACYIGKFKSLIGKELIIQSVTPKGKMENNMTFRIGDIRTIEFDTDYLNSLRLLLNQPYQNHSI